jgi:3-hydroxyisobutyrate dehydrogenase-like beta-hydroxyacid dehydrogenase
VAASIGEVAEPAEIVVTMLVEDAAIRNVALGRGGLCETLRPGSIHLVMGTHGVAVVRELEERHREAGQTLVAAPVLGRPDLAASGQLGIVVAGPQQAVARCEELLKVLGRRTFVAGTRPESATAIKLANNAVLGCAMIAMAEGFALVRKYDVAPQVFQDVMVEGLFGAPAYKIYGQKMVDESFDQVGSPIHVGLKDANLIAAAAMLAGVPMPSHNVYRDRLIGAVAHGDGDRDQAVLGREQARAAGLE